MKYIKQLSCYDLFWILVGVNILQRYLLSKTCMKRNNSQVRCSLPQTVWLIITAFPLPLWSRMFLMTLYKACNTLSGNHPKYQSLFWWHYFFPSGFKFTRDLKHSYFISGFLYKTQLFYMNFAIPDQVTCINDRMRMLACGYFQSALSFSWNRAGSCVLFLQQCIFPVAYMAFKGRWRYN